MRTVLRVYGRPGCVQCEATMRWLRRRALDAVEEALDEHQEALELARSEGITSAPVVVETTQEGLVVDVWGGFQPDRLAAWARRNEERRS